MNNKTKKGNGIEKQIKNIQKEVGGPDIKACARCATWFLGDALERLLLVIQSIESNCNKSKCENRFGKSIVLLEAVDSIQKALDEGLYLITGDEKII